MIFRTIESIIKITIFVFFLALIIGYPIVIYDTNPFGFYYDLVKSIIEVIKQFKG